MPWPSLKVLYRMVGPYLNWAFLCKLTHMIFWRTWSNWWNWNTAEDRLLEFVTKTATRGDPISVLEAVKKYNEEYEWTIMLDPDKTEKLIEVAKEASPKVCFELGCYVGCSALAVASQMPPGGRLITVEKHLPYANVARQLFHFAGLDQVITVFVGKSNEAIELLRSHYAVDKLDFVFLDHLKWEYLPDLKRLEDQRLLRKGTRILADNVGFPDARKYYLDYLESSKRYQTELFNNRLLFFNFPDAMSISVCTTDDE